MPICFHGAGQNYLRPDYSLEVFDNLMMWHTFGQPLGIMAVIVSLASGGVIQRFPNLRDSSRPEGRRGHRPPEDGRRASQPASRGLAVRVRWMLDPPDDDRGGRRVRSGISGGRITGGRTGARRDSRLRGISQIRAG